MSDEGEATASGSGEILSLVEQLLREATPLFSEQGFSQAFKDCFEGRHETAFQTTAFATLARALNGEAGRVVQQLAGESVLSCLESQEAETSANALLFVERTLRSGGETAQSRVAAILFRALNKDSRNGVRGKAVVLITYGIEGEFGQSVQQQFVSLLGLALAGDFGKAAKGNARTLLESLLLDEYGKDAQHKAIQASITYLASLNPAVYSEAEGVVAKVLNTGNGVLEAFSTQAAERIISFGPEASTLVDRLPSLVARLEEGVKKQVREHAANAYVDWAFRDSLPSARETAGKMAVLRRLVQERLAASTEPVFAMRDLVALTKCMRPARQSVPAAR